MYEERPIIVVVNMTPRKRPLFELILADFDRKTLIVVS